MASVQNSAGRFVAPSTASVQAAVAQVNWAAASRFDQMLVNLPGEGSYPIVAAVFGLLAERAAAKRRRMTKAFFQWAVTRGRASAERLGYVALPSPAAQKIEAALTA
jgi:phosphate transport system substrate-binding protein